jgi:hypothetical protein
MGRSIGHWDGNEFIVETTGFRDRLWLTFRGTPLSPNGKLIHHFTKVKDQDRWYLQVITEVVDPTYYTRPWKFARSFGWRPDMGVVEEYNCEEQAGRASAVTGASAEPND